MPTILKNILRFTNLIIDVPAVLPHQINVNGTPKTPQVVLPQIGGFLITANDIDVSVTRTTTGLDTVDVYVELWHTIEAVTPANGLVGLLPFILQPGSNGAGGKIIISPAPLNGGVTDDYDPEGLASADIVRQDLTAPSALTGLARGVDGRSVTIINTSRIQANVLALLHEDDRSTPEDQFLLAGDLDWLIPRGGAITLLYDGLSERWRGINFMSHMFPDGAVGNLGLIIGSIVNKGFHSNNTTTVFVQAGADKIFLGNGLLINNGLTVASGNTETSPTNSAFLTRPILENQISQFTEITPPALAAGAIIVNYNPQGIVGASYIRQDLLGTATVTGLNSVNSIQGRLLTFANIATVVGRDSIFTHEDDRSTEVDRFDLPNQAPLIVPAGDSVTFRFDTTISRWRIRR